MEPLTAIGAAASIATLIEITAKAVSTIYKETLTLKKADSQRGEVVRELGSLDFALRQIYEVLAGFVDGVGQNHRRRILIDHIAKDVGVFETCTNEVQTILGICDKLQESVDWLKKKREIIDKLEIVRRCREELSFILQVDS